MLGKTYLCIPNNYILNLLSTCFDNSKLMNFNVYKLFNKTNNKRLVVNIYPQNNKFQHCRQFNTNTKLIQNIKTFKNGKLENKLKNQLTTKTLLL
jgi:hypothetical protein